MSCLSTYEFKAYVREMNSSPTPCFTFLTSLVAALHVVSLCTVCMQEVLKDYRATVVHLDFMMSSDLSANIIWLETFMKTLDNMDANLHRLMPRDDGGGDGGDADGNNDEGYPYDLDTL